MLFMQLVLINFKMGKNLTACQHDVFALLVSSCWQVWNKLLSSCNKVREANRLATSCSNKSDIICRHWLTTYYEQPVLVLLEQLVAIIIYKLFQTCHNNWEQAVRTHPGIGLARTLLQLVCRPVTTCAFLITCVVGSLIRDPSIIFIPHYQL
jgi:hypothetical protein